MSEGIRRRDFLKWAGAGTAILSAPTLTGCQWQPGAFEICTAAPPGEHGTYFDRFDVGKTLLQRTLNKGLSRGGDFCDIFLEHRVTNWTGMQDGQIDRAYSRIDLGAGIRVLKGDATGFAYCEDLSEGALLSAADTAAAVADAGAHSRPQPLAARHTKNYYQSEIPWTEVGVARKLPIIEHANQVARDRDDRIVKVTVFLGDVTARVLIANSEGLLIEDDRPMASLYITCVAMDEGRVETSYKTLSGRRDISLLSNANVASLARRTADETIRAFGAVEPPTGELPVVLAAATSGILLHEAIGHGMEADFNRKGISIYADRIGKRIASRDVNILDDGTNLGLRGSLNVDDEGYPCERTMLVEKGILRSYMHDRISARHYGVRPTGSGRRQSFRYPPVPRMRNTYMLSGPMDPEEIIASVKKGIYAETMANGQVNIGAGDFTFYLHQGRMIENGKLTDVIKDANMIGNGPTVLESIDMIGNNSRMLDSGGQCGKDGQYVPVGFGLPTVRAHKITIGGRSA